MHSTEVQAKPLFSWKALGWALLYFLVFLYSATGHYLHQWL